MLCGLFSVVAESVEQRFGQCRGNELQGSGSSADGTAIRLMLIADSFL